MKLPRTSLLLAELMALLSIFSINKVKGRQSPIGWGGYSAVNSNKRSERSHRINFLSTDLRWSIMRVKQSLIKYLSVTLDLMYAKGHKYSELYWT